MKKRPYVADDTIIATEIKYTRENAIKAVDDIEDYLNNSSLINELRRELREEGSREIVIDRDISEQDKEKLIVHIPLPISTIKILSDVFEKELAGYEDKEDIRLDMGYFCLYWVVPIEVYLGKEQEKYWYIDRVGAAPCGDQYNRVIDNSEAYNNCKCPKPFKTLCEDLTKILKIYAIKE